MVNSIIRLSTWNESEWANQGRDAKAFLPRKTPFVREPAIRRGVNLKFILIALSFFLITSCSLFSPMKGPEHTYMLTSVPYPQTYPRSKITLFVAPIDSNAIYNRSQIAYTCKPYQIAYFSKNEWVESPALMLHPLLIQTLQNTHFFHAVTSTPVQYDYALNIQLLELKQNFLREPSIVELKLRAQLINSRTNTIVATQLFTSIKRAICRDPYSGVVAANAATAEALTEIAYFTVGNLSH